MKIIPLLFLFSLSLNPVLHAGLGETEVQLAERYGQPLFAKPGSVPDSIWRSYRFQGMMIDVESFDGASQREIIRPKMEGRFFLADVQALIKTNVLAGERDKLEKLDEPDAEGCVEQQGVFLRQGKEIIARASISATFVAMETTEFGSRRTRMYPGGNISDQHTFRLGAIPLAVR